MIPFDIASIIEETRDPDSDPMAETQEMDPVEIDRVRFSTMFNMTDMQRKIYDAYVAMHSPPPVEGAMPRRSYAFERLYAQVAKYPGKSIAVEYLSVDYAKLEMHVMRQMLCGLQTVYGEPADSELTEDQ